MYDHLISVIMSVYNTEESFLRDSIESICEQTYKNIEFIIVTDKPTDNSSQIVKEYQNKDKRIVIIENEKNIGLTKSLNKALSISKGKYIARMDADDVAFHKRLEKQYLYMESHPEVVALGTQTCTSLELEHALSIFPLCDWTPDQQVLKIRMLFHNVGIPHPTAMLRREILVKNRITYDERIKKSQDYKLWVDLMPYGSISMLNEILLMYRVHYGQISTDRKNQHEYAHMISLEQAEKLLGNMTNEEKEMHCCISTVDIPNNNVKNYSCYLRKLIRVNDLCGVYDKSKFKREIRYLWLQKAFRRLIILKRFDMIFHTLTFSSLRPRILKYILENKRIKNMRNEALAVAVFNDCFIR